MARVAILSDTHVPSRAPAIPDWVLEAVGAADHVIHAGDFDSAAALETVRERVTGEFTAVHGNVDPSHLGLPAVAAVQISGRPFVVTHGTGPPAGYRDRVVEAVRREAGEPDAIGVAGHTHAVVDEVYRGVRLLNPGSATGARPAAEATMMVAEVGEGGVAVEVLPE